MILVALILFFSCFSYCEENYEIEDRCKLKIHNPSFANRKTKKLLLPNGLSVLIISDAKIDKSAAALCVMAGSWQDPKKYPGMAHFTEHMLFMGTKAYPGENSFSTFITNHGGENNAYTNCDRTVYALSIQNDAFLESLDRFSHFFIDPLLPEEGMKRELSAVDQEYSKNIEHDGWRKYRVEKETSNQAHPHHAFSIGNSKTLSQIPKNAMKEWIAMNYSASNMHLFIYSPLDIQTLEKHTIAYFSKIPKRQLDSNHKYQPVFSNEQKGKVIYLQPIKDIQAISLSWELPPQFLKDPSQSAELLAYMLSIGSENTLLDTLKKKGYGEKIGAYVERIGSNSGFLTLEVELTNLGLEKYQQVLQLCFDTLKTYQNLPFPTYLFHQRKNMSEIKYSHQSRRESFDFAMDMADKMGDESLATFPQNTYTPQSFEKNKVEALLKHLNPNSCRAFVICDLDKIHKTPTYQEKWLGGKYSIEPLPKESYYTKTLSHISYPKENPFIPSSLELKQTEQMTKPLQIANSRVSKAYYKSDNFYKVPKVAYLLNLKSPYIETTPLSSAMLDLYLRISNDTLNPSLIYARDGGLYASIDSEKLSLQINIMGYSEKAPQLVDMILKTMTSFPTEKQYINQKNALLKSYQNQYKNLPCKQALNLAQTILVNDSPSYISRYKALEGINFESYISFQKLLLQKLFVEAFYAGNLTEKEALAIHNKFLSTLNPLAYENRTERKVMKFSEDQGPFLIKKNTECLGNSCFLVINEGSFTFEDRSVQQILTRALQSDFYDALRTKQKTGYIAQSWGSSIEHELFQFFLVQSNSHDPRDLLNRFDLFLEDYSQTLTEKISQTRFEEIKNSLISQLQDPPVNLFEESLRLQKLAFEYNDFDWIEKRLNGLQSLTYPQFQKISLPFLSRYNKKRLAILYTGKTSGEKEFKYQPVTSFEIKKLANYITKLDKKSL